MISGSLKLIIGNVSAQFYAYIYPIENRENLFKIAPYSIS